MPSQAKSQVAADGQSGRDRFVTLCQQFLVLAVVATGLTPAARTISLDIQSIVPGGSSDFPAQMQTVGDEVPVEVVDAVVEEVRITARDRQRRAQERVAGLRSTLQRTNRGERVRSRALKTDGFTTVGVTWDPRDAVDETEISIRLRSRIGGTWSDWTDVPYHDDHAPDPDSPEAAGSRPGSEAVVVGEVDEVQVEVHADGDAPADLTVAVINPGEAKRTERQEPAIHTDDAQAAASLDSPQASLQLASLVGPVTRRPQMFSRAQWGADEELRSQTPPSYHEVHAGVVHHTVTGNDYAREDVPAIIRGIYAYHVRNRGWRDIGYNFLIDRFGRVWQGRWGGVARPVVGAHTSGLNSHTFSGSAIGNFQNVLPSNAMVQAFGELFAWKLSLYGISPRRSNALQLNGNQYAAIIGHRNAGSTLCPGEHLYNRLGDIRSIAGDRFTGWQGREINHNLTGGRSRDLVVRRQSDGQGFVLPIEQYNGGEYRTRPLVNTGLNLSNARDVLRVGDWTGNGHGDLLIRFSGDGSLYLYPGDGTGRFSERRVIATGMGGVAKLTAVGDFNGNGRPDLMGQSAEHDWAAMLYPGRANRLAAPQRMYSPVREGLRPVPVGRWDRDGAPDVLYRNGTELYVYYGNGPGGFTGRRKLGLNISIYDAFVGVGNIGRGAHGDVVARRKGTNQLYFLPGYFQHKGSFRKRYEIPRRLDADTWHIFE